MIYIFVHVIMLLVLSLAEGFRLTEFFTLLTGNVGAGAASAAVSVIVILYLALFHMRSASIFATAVCIFLSLASFLKPYEDLQLNNAKQSQNLTEKPLPVPQWEPRKYWGAGREDYRKSFNAEVERVKKYNERLEKIVAVSESKDLRLSEIVVFVLGALVLGFCVPVLTFTVSHKLADDITKFKRRNDEPFVKGPFYGRTIESDSTGTLIENARKNAAESLQDNTSDSPDTKLGKHEHKDFELFQVKNEKENKTPFEPRRWPPRAVYKK